MQQAYRSQARVDPGAHEHSPNYVSRRDTLRALDQPEAADLLGVCVRISAICSHHRCIHCLIWLPFLWLESPSTGRPTTAAHAAQNA